ncbi:MAG TPA: hypothetical protein VFV05_13990 [Methylomirabilota bacterium]|nr:hypothetical protein [Methylomirabilota bacterium]
MSSRALDPALDAELLCYCTNLTFGELRAACAQDAWPPADRARTGKLCTGCQGDLLHCLQLLGVRTA